MQIPNEALQRMLKTLMKMVVIESADRQALQFVLRRQGVLPDELFREERMRMRKAVEPAIQQIDALDELAAQAELLDILRRFEGPLQ